MRFERGRAVADAVLFEGYALYPYRATSTKNQLRWQFGVLLPRAASEAGRSDPWWLEAQCLVAAEPGARVAGKLRFLRVRRRRVETPAGAPLESLDVDGKLLIPWDEGEPVEHDFAVPLDGATRSLAVALAGDRTVETVRDAAGREVARVVRTRAPLALHLAADAAPVERPGGAAAFRLRVRVDNVSACADPLAARDALLPAATVGTHLLLGVESGELVSLIDPPEWAAGAAAACKNVGVYPVLACEAGRGDLVLASPIILYDHPAVAPESAGDLFDATEIDEILTLRTLLLTDEEKRQARATDARVAALIDRVDALPPERLAQLHGAFRDVEPIAGAAAGGLRRGGVAVAPGHKVRLRPGPRRSDAQDMFLDGRVATVREVKRDVDGRAWLAVTVDDDPAAELHLWHGRYHYFYADEVEPLS